MNRLVLAFSLVALAGCAHLFDRATLLEKLAVQAKAEMKCEDVTIVAVSESRTGNGQDGRLYPCNRQDVSGCGARQRYQLNDAANWKPIADDAECGLAAGAGSSN